MSFYISCPVQIQTSVPEYGIPGFYVEDCSSSLPRFLRLIASGRSYLFISRSPLFAQLYIVRAYELTTNDMNEVMKAFEEKAIERKIEAM